MTALARVARRPWSQTVRLWAPELQFWGYETGNVLASLAGVGGLALLWMTPSAGSLLPLIVEIPELAATLGIIALVLLTWLAKTWLPRAALDAGWGLWTDKSLMRLSLVLVAATAVMGANWLTLSAVCFASGSALIRLTDHAPEFLKSGAAMLICGGIGLALFGWTAMPLDLVAICLILNGVYVVVAGLLAYRSGVDLCRAQGVTLGTGMMARIDDGLSWTAQNVARPAIFWIPEALKDSRPLYTSMWARLPWRMALALAVTVTQVEGHAVLVLASLCWVLGDLAFGALDRPKDTDA